jgi:hypothetical protein
MSTCTVYTVFSFTRFVMNRCSTFSHKTGKYDKYYRRNYVCVWFSHSQFILTLYIWSKHANLENFAWPQGHHRQGISLISTYMLGGGGGGFGLAIPNWVCERLYLGFAPSPSLRLKYSLRHMRACIRIQCRHGVYMHIRIQLRWEDSFLLRLENQTNPDKISKHIRNNRASLYLHGLPIRNEYPGNNLSSGSIWLMSGI